MTTLRGLLALLATSTLVADFQKLCASVKTEPLPRYRKLHAFCETHRLEPEALRFAKLIAGLKQVEL
jgi:hypothetical protein